MNKNNEEKKCICGFQSRKDFVIWLIAVIIAIVALIGGIGWGIKIGDFGMPLVCGIMLVLIIAIIVGSINSELGAMIIGEMLIILGFVLPLATRIYIIIPLTAIFGIVGIMIIIDCVAELTNTKDRKYYKVIFGTTEDDSNDDYAMTNGKKGKKRKKRKNVGIFYIIIRAFTLVWQWIISGMLIFYMVVFGGVGIFLVYHKIYTWGILIILFAVVIAGFFKVKKK